MACYLYKNFTREMLLSDMAFYSGPCSGEEMPDFRLRTTSGDFISKSDFLGRRPLLLVFASVTDGMNSVTIPLLKDLFNGFQKDIEFASLYVREAHPGRRFPQPGSFEQKASHAQTFRQLFQIPWTVAIDNLSGDLHRALDPKTNALYIMNTDGKVAFRSLWTYDVNALRNAIRQVACNPRAVLRENGERILPLLAGIGGMGDALGIAGDGAARDFLLAAPPAFVASRAADVFHRMRPLCRGILGVSTVVLGLSMFLYGTLRITRRNGGKSR